MFLFQLMIFNKILCIILFRNPKSRQIAINKILAGLVTFLSMFVHILLAPSVVSKSHKKSFKFLDEIDEINKKCIFQNRLINAVKEYSQILIFERTLTTKKKKI